MTIEEAVIARLRDDAAVTALVGNRIHWLVRPQGGALPAIVLTLASEVERQHLKGTDDMIETLVQIDSWAASLSTATEIDAAATAALMPPTTVEGMGFWRASSEGRSSGGEQTDKEFVRRVRRDIRLRHTAA